VSIVWFLCTVLQKIEEEAPSIEESIKNSSVVWGWWHTGGRHLKLMKNKNYTDKFKRVLLLDINHKEAFAYHMARSGSEEGEVISQVRQFTNEAIKRNIEVKWYSEKLDSAVTIYDPESNNGWLVFQDLIPIYKVKERVCSSPIRKKEQPATYEYYKSDFERIWTASILSRVPIANEYE